MLLLSASYAWCRWGAGQWRFSPLMRLGQASLLVYWVHIEFVYGRFSILSKRVASIRTASAGLLTIFLAMVVLASIRLRLKNRPWRQALAPVPMASIQPVAGQRHD
jgi:fucose 4-O-acetylase-like acetyltransferase